MKRYRLAIKTGIPVALVLLLLPVVAALAADTNHSAQRSASAGPVTVIILGGSLSDPFWTAVHRGVRDAGAALKATGARVDYLGPRNYDNFGPDMARLNQTALARNPSAVVSPNWLPGDQTPGLRKIAKAGIPLFEYNTSVQTWRSDGAIAYIGTDEFLGGQIAGKTLVKAGAKNVICVNTTPGAQNAEARCNGMKAGVKAAGGKAKTLELPSSTFTDPNAVTQAVKGTLIADKSIDAVIGIGGNTTDYSAAAIKQAARSGKVTLASFDISVSNLSRILSGEQLFAIDQQPYMQGYYAVSIAFQYAKWGLLPPARWFKTGPLLITKSNAAKALTGAKAGVRGAS